MICNFSPMFSLVVLMMDCHIIHQQQCYFPNPLMSWTEPLVDHRRCYFLHRRLVLRMKSLLETRRLKQADYYLTQQPLMLHHYLEVLHAEGVAYEAEDLWYDYRLSILRMLLVPVMQYDMKIPASIWWPHFDRCYSAIEDLDCLALLD